MARNREREKFVAGIKVGDVVRFHNVPHVVVSVPELFEGANAAGIANTSTLVIRPCDPDAGLKVLRTDLAPEDGAFGIGVFDAKESA